MIVAALAAAMIGQVFDGALLVVIFASSGALEAFVTRRTADEVTALLGLAPQRATRLCATEAEERTEEVQVDDLGVGDLVLVRPGERIGADGEVVAGESEVDQASITGEPLPVFKEPGTVVFAGTVNGLGTLRIRVARPARDSVVARIATLVEQASHTKAKAQLFIERVEQRYSVAVVAATLLLLGVPIALGQPFESALLRAMTFMIVASPCAVVLATMPPLLAVVANAGRHGVLVKSAPALEALCQVSVAGFDKTGTVSRGRPEVKVVIALEEHDETAILGAAAAVEQPSEHPLARAVVAAARERRAPVGVVEGFAATPGRGVAGQVDGRRVGVWSPTMLGGELPAVVELESAGLTAVVVSIEATPIGVIGLADQLRDSATATVRGLHDLGLRTTLLSGDHERAARLHGSQVGIAEIHGGLLPEEKLSRVRRLQEAGERVLFVGDGINDAPAMAAAQVGVALGRDGSDLAVETADVILVRDDLAALPPTVALARRGHRVVVANLVFTACVILGLVTWDVLGTLPLPLGVAGHEGSTVVVALNGLRLLRRSAWSALN